MKRSEWLLARIEAQAVRIAELEQESARYRKVPMITVGAPCPDCGKPRWITRPHSFNGMGSPVLDARFDQRLIDSFCQPETQVGVLPCAGPAKGAC